MAKITGSYEAMVVFSTKAGDEAVAALVAKFKEMIEANAENLEVEEWGKRKLAYEINGLADAAYTLVDFHTDPTTIAELDRVLRINDAVVRHMVVARTDRD